jgi:hypothetical protein
VANSGATKGNAVADWSAAFVRMVGKTFPYWIVEGLHAIRPQAAENLQIGLSMFGL